MRPGLAGWLMLAMSAGVALGTTPAAGEGLDGRLLGRFRLTLYHVAEEREGGDIPVYSSDCASVIARTGRAFHDSLSLQGTGLLADGRLLNFEQRCTCAVAGYQGGHACYRELSRGEFPWGRGAYWNGQFFWLQPFRSAAVDPVLIPIGSVIYIPELAGRALPDGTLFNGCVRAEDTGQAIRGRHLDWFVGPGRSVQWLRGHPPPAEVTAYADSRRCARAFP